jgi:hypothetical protein
MGIQYINSVSLKISRMILSGVLAILEILYMYLYCNVLKHSCRMMESEDARCIVFDLCQ